MVFFQPFGQFLLQYCGRFFSELDGKLNKINFSILVWLFICKGWGGMKKFEAFLLLYPDLVTWYYELNYKVHSWQTLQPLVIQVHVQLYSTLFAVIKFFRYTLFNLIIRNIYAKFDENQSMKWKPANNWPDIKWMVAFIETIFNQQYPLLTKDLYDKLKEYEK